LLVFVSCSIDRLDSSVDLDTVPEFIQLTNSPISKVFLSAISLRMRENTEQEGGFSKVMALIEELIHDNRSQLQSIRRINQRVQGQCLVSNNKLVNRNRNFATLLRYFKSRGQVALQERSEATNIQNNRRNQAKDYQAAQARYNLAFSARLTKWNQRVAGFNAAVAQVGAALKAVADWTPSTKTSFIEQQISETVSFYTKSMEYPLHFDSEMIQLAANDKKIRQRLYEWLNLLKASLLNQLVHAQRARSEVESSHKTINAELSQIVALENSDAARLGRSINNWTVLINNYSQNEKIYSALSVQTQNVLKANREWCNVETSSYNTNRANMEAQLKVFVELKDWLRKNYARVREWIRKKYNH
jgi:hypothetical protein